MPAPHPEDSIIVRNVNIDDPDFKNYFEVKWNSIPVRIPPGDVRRLPRYLAYHFCKHMTDRIIFRMDMAQFGRKQRTSRLRDQKLRDKIQRTCIIAVDQYYMADVDDPREQFKKLYGELNPDDALNPMNLGDVELPLEPPAMDTLEKDNSGNPILPEIESLIPDSDGVGEAELKKKPTKRTKAELADEADQLGIELEGTESADEILEQINAF